MKHIKIIPDCPLCQKELRGVWTYKSLGKDGKRIVGWWECSCGYKSKDLDHKPYDDVKEEIVK